jgi:hypothetical protein
MDDERAIIYRGEILENVSRLVPGAEWGIYDEFAQRTDDVPDYLYFDYSSLSSVNGSEVLNKRVLFFERRCSLEDYGEMELGYSIIVSSWPSVN